MPFSTWPLRSAVCRGRIALCTLCILAGTVCPPFTAAAADELLGWSIVPAADGELFQLHAPTEDSAATADDSPVLTAPRNKVEWRRFEELQRIHGTGHFNIRFRTLGGKQLWADEFVHAGWRIQQNTTTGRYRLLDDRDVRHAWGSYESCRVAFERERLRRGLVWSSRRAVVLLHGLGRSKDSLAKLADELEAAGYAPVAINYPSTRASLPDHAAQVVRVLDRLDGIDELSFVTHSLGGLIARAVLARDDDRWRQRSRIERLVMLAPPSRGSALADRFHGREWFDLILGPAAVSATSDQVATLPLPPCEFAVIAGGLGNGFGLNPLVPGDDDGLLRVATTRLDGGAFLRVNSRHRKIAEHPRVRAAVRHFLDTGILEPVEIPAGVRRMRF